jgi:hypothetical protein
MTLKKPEGNELALAVRLPFDVKPAPEDKSIAPATIAALFAREPEGAWSMTDPLAAVILPLTEIGPDVLTMDMVPVLLGEAIVELEVIPVCA